MAQLFMQMKNCVSPIMAQLFMQMKNCVCTNHGTVVHANEELCLHQSWAQLFMQMKNCVCTNHGPSYGLQGGHASPLAWVKMADRLYQDLWWPKVWPQMK
jgi:nitrite reductase/ring-hydroxylating ferredoxin subunit